MSKIKNQSQKGCKGCAWRKACEGPFIQSLGLLREICPCAECIIKSMCKEICEKWNSWIEERKRI